MRMRNSFAVGRADRSGRALDHSRLSRTVTRAHLPRKSQLERRGRASGPTKPQNPRESVFRTGQTWRAQGEDSGSTATHASHHPYLVRRFIADNVSVVQQSLDHMTSECVEISRSLIVVVSALILTIKIKLINGSFERLRREDPKCKSLKKFVRSQPSLTVAAL